VFIAKEKETMAKNVWISLDNLTGHGTLTKEALSLLEELGIVTDYWGRAATQISEEALARLRQFERDNSDDPETFDWEQGGFPYYCSIVSELSDEQFAQYHTADQKVGSFIESYWTRN
jgi:hypothetical protein